MDKQKVSQETYVDLARLAHESFEQRRSYEWKMHFGLWFAIAAVVYMARKEEISIIGCLCEAVIVGFGLWCLYVLHFYMVTKGHWEDKRRKHYYMDKAEGKHDVKLQERDKEVLWREARWVIPYWVFTLVLIWYAMKLLLEVSQ